MANKQAEKEYGETLNLPKTDFSDAWQSSEKRTGLFSVLGRN